MNRLTQILSISGVLLASVLFALYFRTPFVDDAYITYRYANNLSQGWGLVYNPTETVLGLTTPLWAFLISIFGILGVGPEIASTFLSLWSALFLSLMIYRYFFEPALGPKLGLIGIPLFVLNFHILMASFSGMEAMLYTCLVLSCLLSLSFEKMSVATILASFALLTRPDGAILFLIIGFKLLTKPIRTKVGIALLTAILVLPWLVYAEITYGSAIPHSVAAKRVIHFSTWDRNLAQIGQALFAMNPLDFLIAVLGSMGLAQLLRSPGNWIYPLWTILYIAGLVLSGVSPVFYWYFTPLWIFFVGPGLSGLLKKIPQPIPHSHQAILLCSVMFSVIYSLYRTTLSDPAALRDRAYQQIAKEFSAQVSPKDSLYLCETGILGYFFKDNYIIDASGINSDQVFQERKRIFDQMKAEGKAFENMSKVSRWSMNIVERYKPNWIISARYNCQLALMEDELPWFKSEYHRVGLYYPEHLGGIAVYHRQHSN